MNSVDEELCDEEVACLVDTKEDLDLGAAEEHLPGDEGCDVCCGGDSSQQLAKATVV